MDYKALGNHLKEIRENKNLTKKQLAEIINVSPQTITRWETGNVKSISLKYFIALADTYKLTIEYLLLR